MVKLFKRLAYTCTTFLMFAMLVSCSGGSDTVGSSGGPGTGGTTGTLSIGLTDAPAGYDAIYVTIEEISVHNEITGWETALTLNPVQTFNLLELVGGVIRDLGVAELEAGHYDQMRLKLSTEPDDALNILNQHHEYANYLILEEGEDQIELKVPSGLQTGIKLVKGFDIIVSGSTELVLDFDAHKSVVQAGKSGKWLLKPTIKVLDSVTYSVEGTVDEGVNAPIEGASINAQIYDSGAVDPKGNIASAAGTFSDADGKYFMYLPITQDIFNIVATKDGYNPECQVLDSTTTGVMAYTKNFSLTPADAVGMLKGSVTGLATADSALFSIRQTNTTCGMIEVASASVVNTTSDPAIYFEPITLPAGTYEVVVSADGEVTQVWSIEVAADTETVMDVTFPTPSVFGIVYDEADSLGGATVSAQVYDSSATDPKDEITETDTTFSNSNGVYYLYLPTDRPLNIVATMSGLESQCEVVTEVTSNINFILDTPDSGAGTVKGSVAGLATADAAIYNIRQLNTSCGKIEVASASVPNSDDPGNPVYFDPITLPVGIYEVVVSADGEITQVLSIEVVADTETPIDAVFPTAP